MLVYPVEIAALYLLIVVVLVADWVRGACAPSARRMISYCVYAFMQLG